MKKRYSFLAAVLSCLLLPSCAAPAIAGSDFPSGQALKDDNGISMTKISTHAWVFTTYGDYKGAQTPANGMLIATSSGFVMVDTPWTETETEGLLSMIDKQFGKKVTLALFTHAHADRIGGIKVLKDHGIRTESTKKTADQAERNGYVRPDETFASDAQKFTEGGVRFETYFPGKAHSPDNIVIYLPADKVLFGGCMTKAADATSLGDMTDADAENWPIALDNVIKKYPDAAIIVPGHGAWGSIGLLEHMRKLFQ